jgi:histidine triad (HIT) family protein
MSNDDLNSLSPEEIIEMQRKNCIFCKIIHGEIPSNEIYSDDKVFVILDINPASDGHCLILPKHHYQILPQIPDELIGYLSVIAKRTSRALLKSIGIKGTTIFIANGAIAGQKAPHFMIHVIPRKRNDLLFQLPKHASDEKKLEEITKKLSARLAAMMGRIQISHNKEVKQHHVEKSEDKERPKEEDAKEDNEDNNQESGKDNKMDLDKIANLFG